MKYKKPIIYYLADPRTMEIRYVGKTEQKLTTRIRGHMKEAAVNCDRAKWLSELKREGIKPLGVVILELDGSAPWQVEEKRFIAILRAQGARLTNNTSGGDGTPGLPEAVRDRITRVWIGRKHRPESIAKIKAARALRVTTWETRQKMSRSQTGRKITWGDKLSEANRKLTPDQAESIRQRLLNGERTGNLAREFGMHRTSISKIKMGTYFDKYRKK